MNQIIEMNIEIDKILRNSFLKMTQIRLQNLEGQAEKAALPSIVAKVKPEKNAK